MGYVHRLVLNDATKYNQNAIKCNNKKKGLICNHCVTTEYKSKR